MKYFLWLENLEPDLHDTEQMMSRSDVMGELRGLLAQRPSLQRDGALCELLAFCSRVELEQSGAWRYLSDASTRGKLSAPWDDAAWYDVRAGRLWGMAKKGVMNLRGVHPIKEDRLEHMVASTHEVPCLALDLAHLGELLPRVLLEFLAHADLSRLVWLDLSSARPTSGVIELLTMYDLPSLKSLELGGLDVQGLHEVPWLGQLVHLGVSGCRVDDAWMREHITPEVMPSLGSLDLEDTEVAEAVWQQLGEQFGYEQMYALRVRDTWMNAQELGLCRWLPCLPLLDTFSCNVHGNFEGVAYEECMDVLLDGVGGVRDLDLSFVGVAEDVQHDVLAQLAHASWFDRLCGLGLEGILINNESLSALGVGLEAAQGTPLYRFAMRDVRVHQQVLSEPYWGDYRELLVDLEALKGWARLSALRRLELASMPLKARAEPLDCRDELLDMILSIKTLEHVSLHHLNYMELNTWCRLWSTSKAVGELRELELHDCDLRLSHIELLREGALRGPARWLFDGVNLEERCLMLEHLSDCLSPESAMWPWLGMIDLSSARDYVGDTSGDDDYFW